MKEEIIWKLVFWEMKMGRDGWWGKPIFLVRLKYGTYRDGRAEVKWREQRFKTLKSTFEYLEKAIGEAEGVRL